MPLEIIVVIDRVRRPTGATELRLRGAFSAAWLAQIAETLDFDHWLDEGEVLIGRVQQIVYVDVRDSTRLLLDDSLGPQGQPHPLLLPSEDRLTLALLVAEYGCDRCHTSQDDPSWRWNGTRWEHKCRLDHPQCGYDVMLPLPLEMTDRGAIQYLRPYAIQNRYGQTVERSTTEPDDDADR